MSFKLDLGKMKHVSSDDKKTTLQHPRGHTVTLYHNVLSTENQDALKALSKVKSPESIAECKDNKPEFGKVIHKANGGKIPANKQQSLPFGGTSPGQPQSAMMADGGKAPAPNGPQSDPTPPSPTEHDTPANVNTPSSISDAVSRLSNAWADGGEVLMAEGGEANYAYDAGLPCLNPHCKSHGRPHPNCRCYSSASHFAEGGEAQKVRYCANGKPHNSACMYAKGGPVYYEREKGVNKTAPIHEAATGRRQSQAGIALGVGSETAKGEHRETLKELRSMPNPKLKGLANGGISEQGRDIRHGNKQSDPDKKALAQNFAREDAKGRIAEERHVKPNLKGLAEGGKVDSKFEDIHNKQTELAKNKYPNAKSPELMKKSNIHPPHIPSHTGYGRQLYADGGQTPRPIPGGGITPEKSSIDKLIDMKHAESAPKDESQTEREIDQYEASQPPSALERSIQDRQQSRNNDQEPAQEMSPVLQPGMPGYNEQSQPIDDTEQPPQGPAGQIDQGNDHYGHPDMDANSPEPAQDQPPAPGQAPTQPNPSPNQIPQTEMQPPDPGTQLAQSHLQENQAFQQDLNNGHITPKTYSDLFNYKKDGSERSTLGKIGMIFSMMVGGAGAGLTHQPNVALQMMDNVIKNDLEAQKTSKANGQNFLKLNQERLLNNAHVQQALASTNYTNAQKDAIRQGIAMKAYTQSYMDMASTAVHDQMEKLKTMQPGTPAYQQAAQTAMLMAQAVEKNNVQAAVLGATGVKALGGMYGQTDASNPQNSEQQFQEAMQNRENMGDKDAADSLRARHIPGVPGFATQPVDEGMRSKFRDMDVLDNKVKDVLDFAQKNRGSINPAVLKQARQKAEELTSFYNKSVDSLGMTQGRLGWLEEQIKKNPTSLIQQLLGNNATLREIQSSNENRKNLQLQKLGFPVKANTTPGQSGPGTNGQEGISKSGRPMIFRNGAWNYK